MDIKIKRFVIGNLLNLALTVKSNTATHSNGKLFESFPDRNSNNITGPISASLPLHITGAVFDFPILAS